MLQKSIKYFLLLVYLFIINKIFITTNIPEGYANKLHENVMRVNTNENVDFEEILWICLCPRYQ